LQVFATDITKFSTYKQYHKRRIVANAERHWCRDHRIYVHRSGRGCLLQDGMECGWFSDSGMGLQWLRMLLFFDDLRLATCCYQIFSVL